MPFFSRHSAIVALLIALGLRTSSAPALAQSPGWQVNPADFESSLSITAQVIFSGGASMAEGDILAAFVGEEVRGVAAPLAVGGINLYFLSAYANTSGEELTFKAYDSSRDLVQDLDQTLSFLANSVVGTPTDPLTLQGSAAPVAFSLLPGWNLVGYPASPDNASFQVLFPSAVAGSLFGFEGSYQVPAGGALQPGKGYWLRSETTASPLLSGAPSTSVTVPVVEGWNLISGPACSVSFDSVQDGGGVLLAGSLFGFAGSYSTSESLEAGKGYWVRASGSGSVTAACGTGKGSTSHSANGFSEVILTDASGARQTVLVGDVAAAGLRQGAYTMPPPSPGGGLRAVFAPDRWAGGNERLEISGAEWPIRVALGKGSPPVEMTIGLMAAAPTLLKHGDSVTVQTPSPIFLAPPSERPDASGMGLELYPNPMDDSSRLRILVPEAGAATIRVVDLLGRTLGVRRFDHLSKGPHTIPLPVNDLAAGTYVVQARIAGGQSSVLGFRRNP